MGERIYHVWFGTKRRIPALQGQIDVDVMRLLTENALRAEARLLEAETAFDHVHLVLAVPEGKSLSSVMHQIKGATSRALFLKYPDLKSDMHESALWQKGYSFRRLEPDDIAAARGYVRTQQSRPLRHEHG
ncbi:MAG: IS200/IS605 family transposase [Dehalococcoidia bacterium]